MFKKLLYRLLESDMQKRLAEKHGGQFIHDVMKTFGLEDGEYDPFREASGTISLQKD